MSVATGQPPPKAKGMLEYALADLRQELSIFPVCSPGAPGRCLEGHPPSSQHGPDDVGKTPLVVWKPFQSRVPTEAEVRGWWRRWPQANIGMATGHLCGMCVIDLDGSAARAEAERRGLRPGPLAATGRVGGYHAYCDWRDDAPTVFSSSNGIDFRGEGGYVLRPPSRHRSGAVYRWVTPFGTAPLPELPDWINELAAVERPTSTTARVVLGDIPEHQRNTTLLSFGGSMRRRGMSHKAIEAALLIENADRCRPPLDDDEVLRIAASVARYTPPTSDGVFLPPVMKVQVG